MSLWNISCSHQLVVGYRAEGPQPGLGSLVVTHILAIRALQQKQVHSTQRMPRACF